MIDADPEGETVRTAGGYTVPYELLEIGLYMTEFAAGHRVDYEKPVSLDWLYDVGLPDRFSTMFWQ